jgi:hypothetical protein
MPGGGRVVDPELAATALSEGDSPLTQAVGAAEEKGWR